MVKAFIFDMNGTMIDDMGFHLNIWDSIINGELKGGLTRDEVSAHMYGKNEEVLHRIFGKERLTDAEMQELSMRKEDMYQEAYKPHLKLIAGLQDFLEKAHTQHIPMAIGTAAINYNVEFVVDNLHLRPYFKSIVTADDVHESKPHPETFLKAAAAVGVDPKDCIVFEDAPKGVEAAQNAGMQSVVITTMHQAADFSKYNNVLLFISDYNDERLLQIL